MSSGGGRDPLYALHAAGVGIVERVARACGIEPGPLFNELYCFCSESTTSRIETVRSDDVIDAWLASLLASLPASPTCFILDTWTSLTGHREWLRVTAPADPGWLARLWNADEQRDSVLLLSPDGRQLLFVISLHDGLLRAVRLETRAVLAMRTDRDRLDATLAATPGLLRVAMPQAPRALHATELRTGAPAFTLPLSSSDARRDAWLIDACERWRALPQPLDDEPNAEHHGPYLFSLAGSDILATLGAYIETVSVVATLWQNAGLERLAVIDDEHTRAFLATREAQHFAAWITELRRFPF